MINIRAELLEEFYLFDPTRLEPGIPFNGAFKNLLNKEIWIIVVLQPTLSALGACWPGWQGKQSLQISPARGVAELPTHYSLT